MALCNSIAPFPSQVTNKGP